MITSNAKKFRPLGTSAAIGILLGSCIATTPPAKADPPAAPSPAPAAPSAKKKIHRLIPRDKHAMSSDEALSKFKSKNVKAVALLGMTHILRFTTYQDPILARQREF